MVSLVMYQAPENADCCARCGVASRGKTCPCQQRMATGSTLLKASRTSTRPIQIGMILANCRILQPLGIGSSGTVYRGFHIVLNRAVAIKILTLTESNKEVQAQRFLSEARSVSSIKHEHIVSIYDAGWSEGHCYIVMELVPGQSLTDFIQSQEAMSLSHFFSIARQCCLGLSAAHDAGIIHRDVKAQNILLDPSHRVKVCDFGLAQRIHGHPEFSRYRLVSGTPTYMSPEQIRAQNVDPRSDVYSLGITFFEMLTGSPPFHHKTVREVMAAHLNQQAPSLALERPDIPSILAELIGQCLEKDPQRRPQNIMEILTRLDAIQSHTKRIILPRGRLKRESRARGPSLLAAILCLTLSIFAMNAHQNERDAKKARGKALAQLKSAREEANQSRRVLSLLHRAQDSARRGQAPVQIEEFTETALEISHNSYETLLLAANIYESAGFPERSRFKLRQALDKRPPAYEALFYLHALDSKNGSPGAATPYLEQILIEAKQRNEVNEFILFAKARREQRGAHWAAAIKTYSDLERLSPRLPELYLNRARCRIHLENFKGALKDCQRSQQLGLYNPTLEHTRGLAYQKLKQHKKAINAFQEALKRVKKTGARAIILLDLGLSLEALNEHPEAVKTIKEALELTQDPALLKSGRLRLRALLNH